MKGYREGKFDASTSPGLMFMANSCEVSSNDWKKRQRLKIKKTEIIILENYNISYTKY